MSVSVLAVVLGVIFFILRIVDKNGPRDRVKDIKPIGFIDEFSVKLEENIIVNGSVSEKTIVVDDRGNEITKSSSRITYTTKEKKKRVVNSRVIFKFQYKNNKYEFYKDFPEDEINIRMWLYQQEELKIFVADYSSVVSVTDGMKSFEYAFIFDFKGFIVLNV